MKKLLIINTSWSLLNDILFSILGIVFFLMLSRTLGEANLGLYSYATSFLLSMSVFLDLGITAHYWREWSNGKEVKQKDLINIVSVKAVLALLFSLFILTYSIFVERQYFVHFFVLLLASLADSYRSISLSYYRSQNQFRKVFFLTGFERSFALLGGIACLLLGYGVLEIFFVMLISQVSSLLLMQLHFPLPFPRIVSFNKVRKLLVDGFPVFFILFLTGNYQKIDSMIIRFMIGLEGVGLYNAAYRILDTTLMVPRVIILVFFPSLAQLWQENQGERLSGVLSLSIKYLAVFSVYIAIFITFYAREILHFLYGSRFIESAGVLSILSWATVFFFMTAPLYSILLGAKQDAVMLRRLIFLNIFNAGGNMLLIPFGGIEAAALLTVLTEAIGFFWLVTSCPVSLDWSWASKLFWIVLLLCGGFFLWHPPLLLAGLISASVYLLANSLLGVVAWKEINPKAGA